MVRSEVEPLFRYCLCVEFTGEPRRDCPICSGSGVLIRWGDAWIGPRFMPPSGGDSRRASLPRSSVTFSVPSRDNREATPVMVQEGGE